MTAVASAPTRAPAAAPATPGLRAGFAAVLGRDLRLAVRRPLDAALPIAFFFVAASLFPLGIGPEPQTLRHIAPGVVWVGALLATMLSLPTLYGSDRADGSLDALLLAPLPLVATVLAKALAHWLVLGLPLVLAGPVIGAMFGLSGASLAVLALTLALGTPVLSLLGGLGAALTLGVRSAALLNILIVLPLAVPALVFGTGAVSTAEAGLPIDGHLSLLGALLLGTLVGAPPATAAALRISVA